MGRGFGGAITFAKGFGFLYWTKGAYAEPARVDSEQIGANGKPRLASRCFIDHRLSLLGRVSSAIAYLLALTMPKNHVCKRFDGPIEFVGVIEIEVIPLGREKHEQVVGNAKRLA